VVLAVHRVKHYI
jgi:hypothetical protein